MSDFFELIPIRKAISVESESKKKKTKREKEEKPKVKKPKFKKGSWKDVLFKRVKDWKSSKLVEDFHFVKTDNLLVYKDPGSKPKVVSTKTRFDLDRIRKIHKSSDEAFVLISAFDRMYMKISLKSYLRLMEIDKIAISFRLRACFDGEEEVMDVYQTTQIIDNINALANFIDYHRRGVEGVYEVQAQCCGYTDYFFKFKILVYKRDGSVDTYKSDMNDFMKDYDLYQF